MLAKHPVTVACFEEDIEAVVFGRVRQLIVEVDALMAGETVAAA